MRSACRLPRAPCASHRDGRRGAGDRAARARARRSPCGSELLHPRPEVDFKSPRRAMLAIDVHVGLCNGIRIQHAVLATGCRAGIACLADAAVDHEMCDVDVLWAELAREALREPAQREL